MTPRPRPCSVPGCGFAARHAGSHIAQVPEIVGRYCAPARCYCGDCPWWTPPAPPPPPPERVAQIAAAIRHELRRQREAGST